MCGRSSRARRSRSAIACEVRLVGRARHLLDVFEAERARVLEKRGDVLVGVLAQRHPGLLGAGDRAVVDVREVHHLATV